MLVLPAVSSTAARTAARSRSHHLVSASDTFSSSDSLLNLLRDLTHHHPTPILITRGQ